VGHSRGMVGYRVLAEAIRGVLLRGGVAPRRQVLPIPGGEFLVMPAADEEVAVCKLVTVEAHREPRVQAEVWVRRLSTGEVFHLPGEELTRRRTAALSLLAALVLAPRKEGALLIVGPGAQGEAHLEAFLEAFPLSRLYVRGRGRERVEALLQKARGMGLEAVEWVEEVVPADVAFLVTATNSPTPILPERLPPRVFLSAVGSYRPHMREVPEALVAQAALYVDTEDALLEAGELQGIDRPVVPLKEALLGRRGEGEFVLFKSVGHALFDLAAARAYLGLG